MEMVYTRIRDKAESKSVIGGKSQSEFRLDEIISRLKTRGYEIHLGNKSKDEKGNFYPLHVISRRIEVSNQSICFDIECAVTGLDFIVDWPKETLYKK